MEFQFALPANPIGSRLHQDLLQGILTDITLEVGSQTFPAHRLVLRHASPFFEALLSEHWDLSNSSIKVYHIEEQYVEPEMMPDLLKFFYTGQITLTPDNAHALFIAAHYLQADELLTACEKHLCRILSVADVVAITLLADRFGLLDLFNQCDQQICLNLALLQDARLMQLSESSISRIACHLFWPPNRMEMAIELLNRWIDYDPADRREQVSMTLESLASPPLYPESIDQLFCIGGTSSADSPSLSSVSRFNPLTHQWQSMAPMPYGRSGFAGTVFGTKIYVIGEDMNLPGAFSVYDCLEDAWKELPEVPSLDGISAIEAFDGRLYFVGGTLRKFGEDFMTCPCYQYDPGAEVWYSMQRMLVRRDKPQLVEYDEHLYAIGGVGAGTSAERYDPYEDTWTMIAPANYVHEEHSAAAHEGRIFVYSSSGFEAYKPETDTWQKLTKADTDADYTSRLVSLDGSLLMVGGGNKDGRACAAIYSYDEYADHWSRLPDMDVARAQHCAFVVDF